jgi:hypothetical protein
MPEMRFISTSDVYSTSAVSLIFIVISNMGFSFLIRFYPVIIFINHKQVDEVAANVPTLQRHESQLSRHWENPTNGVNIQASRIQLRRKEIGKIHWRKSDLFIRLEGIVFYNIYANS